MLNKIVLILAMTGLLGVGIWYHLRVAEERAIYKFSTEQYAKVLAETEADRQKKEQISIQRQKDIQELTYEKEKLANRLGNLKRTQAQRDCDAIATPADTVEWLSEHPGASRPEAVP